MIGNDRVIELIFWQGREQGGRDEGEGVRTNKQQEERGRGTSNDDLVTRPINRATPFSYTWFHLKILHASAASGDKRNFRDARNGENQQRRDAPASQTSRPRPTRHPGEDFRQLGRTWNLAGAEIREFIVAVRRINRARRRRRVAPPDTLRWRAVTSSDKRQRDCYFQRARRCQARRWCATGRRLGRDEGRRRVGRGMLRLEEKVTLPSSEEKGGRVL
jgi:hypothetical protein